MLAKPNHISYHLAAWRFGLLPTVRFSVHSRIASTAKWYFTVALIKQCTFAVVRRRTDIKSKSRAEGISHRIVSKAEFNGFCFCINAKMLHTKRAQDCQQSGCTKAWSINHKMICKSELRIGQSTHAVMCRRNDSKSNSCGSRVEFSEY